MQPPGRHAAPCTRAAASRSSACHAACCADAGFLDIHGSELQFCAKRSFGLKLQPGPKLQLGSTLRRGPKRPGSRSECAGLLAPFGNDGVSHAASGQFTADDSRKWQTRYHCG